MPFRNPIAGVGGTLIIDQLRSANYVDGTSGWQITRDGQADFQDITARGNIAASAIAGDTINLAGTDLLTLLGQTSIGKLLSARLAQQAADLSIVTTATKNFELNCGTVVGGRTYRVTVTLLCRNTGTFSTADRIQFGFRYTTDGTTPTTASPQMLGGFWDNSITPSTNWQSYTFTAEADIASDGPLKIAFTSDLVTGTGTYSIYASSSTASRPVMSLYDDGPLGTRNDSALTLTGGGVTTFTKTFNAIWAWGYDPATFGTRSDYIYIGTASGATENFGAVGFDSAAIVAALTGSVTPTSLTLKYTTKARSSSGGLDLRVLSHNYASRAAIDAVTYPQTYTKDGAAFTAITTVSNTVPNVRNSLSLGTGVFAQFKAASRKGIVFAPLAGIDGSGLTPADSSGQVFGDGGTAGVTEAQLVFVYQGTS